MKELRMEKICQGNSCEMRRQISRVLLGSYVFSFKSFPFKKSTHFILNGRLKPK